MLEQNIFGIETPEIYECRISRYALGHSELEVEIRFSPKGLVFSKVCFHFVEYFSGPLSWKGANFQQDDWQNALDIIRTLDRFHQFSEVQLDILSDRLKLYVVQTPSHTIKIVAAAATVLETTSSDDNLLQH